MTNDKQRQIDRKKAGMPFRTLNVIMAVVTLVVSILLLVTTVRTMRGYRELRQVTEDYIDWEKCANDMQQSSDYLTDQIRYYVETGEKIYLDNYFIESKITKRRDNALEKIEAEFGETDTYKSLAGAMSESVDLMNREYYAMRLKLEALGEDLGDYPVEIQEVILTDEDAALPKEEKAALARTMVFDDVYREKKDFISKYTGMCLNKLVEEIETRQEKEADELDSLLRTGRMLIISLIVMVMVFLVATTFQIIRPLVTAIPRIRADEPIPVKGASEFRFLAETYNQMYESNQESKHKLEFAASHDPLTGIYNRSGFDRLMKSVNFKNVSLLLIDVDYFKAINDRYGHEIGDKILVKVTGCIKERFRAEDCFCRIGGDEFALFMNADASNRKELIASKINAINRFLAEEGELPPTSISVGVAFGSGRHAGNIFNEADKALYVTKQNGRRGCTFYEDTLV